MNQCFQIAASLIFDKLITGTTFCADEVIITVTWQTSEPLHEALKE